MLFLLAKMGGFYTFNHPKLRTQRGTTGDFLCLGLKLGSMVEKIQPEDVAMKPRNWMFSLNMGCLLPKSGPPNWIVHSHLNLRSILRYLLIC